MFELLFMVALVVLTSAMCSLFEAVLYSVPLSHIESLSESGKASGALLKRMRQRVDEPITAILSLNTIANTGGAAIAGAIAARELGGENATEWDGYMLAAFPIVFTLAILLFSEVFPKTAGVVYSRPLAGFIAAPLQLLVWVCIPFIWLCRSMTRLIGQGDEEAKVSEEEIRALARLGMRSGDVEEDRALVIQNILSLEEKQAWDIMTPRMVVFTLEASRTLDEVRASKDLVNYSRIPVWDNDRDDIVGIVHRREILKAIADDKHEVKVEQFMRPVNFVIESITLDRLLRMFLDGKEHMFVVLDEFGGFSGVVTLEDVLEEILGREIVDEFDRVADMRQLAHDRRREAIEGKKRRG